MSIDELIAALETAECGSRELDHEIWKAFGSKATFNGIPTLGNYLGLGSFTTSVDATLRLMDEVLPSMRILTITDDTQLCGVTLNVFPNGLSQNEEFFVGSLHYNFPIALCIAILKAHKENL